jgi:hypothetical protein
LSCNFRSTLEATVTVELHCTDSELMIPSGPRSERNTSERPSSRARVDFFFFFFPYLASSSPPVLQQSSFKAATQVENDLRVPIPILPTFTASPFSYFLSLTPLGQLPTDTSCYHVATALVLSPRLSSSFVYLHFLHFILITGNPEVAAMIPNLDIADRQRACI